MTVRFFLLAATLCNAMLLAACGAEEGASSELTTSDQTSNTSSDYDTSNSNPESQTGQTNNTTSGGQTENNNQSNTLVVDSALLPFDQAPRSQLTASNKKVFAHYFTPYPISLSNKIPSEGYYRAHYMNPYGENSKFYSKGGMIRQKPLDRAPIPTYEDFINTDMRQEIRLAADMGIDGFAVDILNYSGYNWDRTVKILDLAAQEYDDFHILLMPDMISLSDPSGFVDMIRQLASKPAAYRLADGRLLIAPYYAERQSPAWWVEQVQKLRTYGIDVALLPVYQGWRADLQDFISEFPTSYQDVLYGVSDWGPRTPEGSERLVNDPVEAQAYGLKWMAPVAPQDVRHKVSTYVESRNSLAMRTLWMSAINGGADMVQIITWNDYSEGTEISPSTGTRFGFYDLATFYTQWFKLGKPEIVRDALYAFYREHHTATALGANAQQTEIMDAIHGGTPNNEVELLAFLTAPATLEIDINGQVQRQVAAAGITSFRAPMRDGTPVFRMTRGGKVIQEMTGGVSIKSQIRVQNMLYHAQSSRRQPPQPSMLSWPWRLGNYSASQSLLSAHIKSPFTAASNFKAIDYYDATANRDLGFGYSFISPGTGKIKVQFDFQITASRNGYIQYEVNLADSAGNTGATLVLDGGAVSGVTMASGGDSNQSVLTPSTVENNRWYRVEMKVDGLNKYDVTISDSLGIVAMATDLAFDNPLSGLGSLVFRCVQNDGGATGLLVDNVQVTEL